MSGAGGLDARVRERMLSPEGDLRSVEHDLVVIGGGISGVGVAREAARRGLKVALLEGRDFASGTSSRSSKLIHGGFRYLERAEVGLVRRTALERKAIHQWAPHLAEPRWMVLPFRSRTAIYSFRLAVTTYERLGAVRRADLHRVWSGSTLASQEPCLDRARFPHAIAYREYLTDDARLVLANLRQASAHGAVALNHAKVVGFERRGGDGPATGVIVEADQQRFCVRGRCIVNAAGPWVEKLLELEAPRERPLLHLSKGVHISLPADRLPIRNMLVLRSADRRRIFAIRRGEVVYVGTTDTTYDGGPTDWPEIELADVEYLLEAIPRHLSLDPVRPDEVVGAWAGLRPLLADPNKKNPSELSRRDEVLIGEAGVISVAGGKLTGYPSLARKVVRMAAQERGLTLGEEAPEEALPGGDFSGGIEPLAQELVSQWQVAQPLAERLVRLYGTEARDVLELGAARLSGKVRAVEGEVRWAIRNEGALDLEDLYYRRLQLPWYETSSAHALKRMSEVQAEELSVSPSEGALQLREVRARQAQDLAFSSPPTPAPKRDLGAELGLSGEGLSQSVAEALS